MRSWKCRLGNIYSKKILSLRLTYWPKSICRYWMINRQSLVHVILHVEGVTFESEDIIQNTTYVKVLQLPRYHGYHLFITNVQRNLFIIQVICVSVICSKSLLSSVDWHITQHVNISSLKVCDVDYFVTDICNVCCKTTLGNCELFLVWICAFPAPLHLLRTNVRSY